MTAIHPFDVQARTELAAPADAPGESIEAMASANACFPGYPTTVAPAASVHPVTNPLLAGRPLGPVVVNRARTSSTPTPNATASDASAVSSGCACHSRRPPGAEAAGLANNVR